MSDPPHLPGFGPEIDPPAGRRRPTRRPEPHAQPPEPLTHSFTQTSARTSVEPPTQPAAAAPAFTIDVVRSARRRRTVGAHLDAGVLKITVPTWMSSAETEMWTEKMAASFRRKMSADRIDLAARSTTLARRYQLPRPRDIRWADDMIARWGSCTTTTGHVRISTRIAAFPDWVIDYVIVHELVHLEVAGHGPDFWQLAYKFPKAERAIGYLIARAAMGDDSDPAGG